MTSVFHMIPYKGIGNSSDMPRPRAIGTMRLRYGVSKREYGRTRCPCIQFLSEDKIFFRTCGIEQDHALVQSVIDRIFDHAAKRCDTDASGNENMGARDIGF